MARPATDIKQRVLRAARVCFLHKGVDATSLRQIASRAKTSVGMVYYYFPTKEELFLGVVEQTYERVLKDLEQALAPDKPVRERLRGVFVRIGNASDDEFEIIQLVLREALISPERLEHLLPMFQKGHLPLLWRAIADGVQEGELDKHRHPALLVLSSMAVGVVPQLIRRRAGKRKPLADLPQGEKLADQLIDVLFSGIGARQSC